MKWIAHRINSSDELKDIPSDFGAEIDLRDSGHDVVLAHDPFQSGELFSDWLKQYHLKGPLILNIKSERIEWKILEELQKAGIQNYFFLDSSFPMIIALNRENESRIALRFSEMEGLDTLRNMAGHCEWVWVDCFTKMPLHPSIYSELKNLGYKICLVSPDLQGRPEDISHYADLLKQLGISPDAICVKHKNIGLWT